MFTITPAAAEYVRSRGEAVHLVLPPFIDCCIQLQEAPSVSLGEPGNPESYEIYTTDGIKIFAPAGLKPVPLKLTLRSFFGMKKLAIEGWPLA